MTPSPKPPSAIPRPLVIGLLAIVVSGVIWQAISITPVALPPAAPMLTGTTVIAQSVVSAGGSRAAPTLTSGDLVLSSDGTLWTAWLEFDGTVGQLQVARSADAGQSFEPAETLIVPDLASSFGTPIRMAAGADGDLVLGAMNTRLTGPPPMQDQLVTVFRRAAHSTAWSPLPEAESLGVTGSLRLQSLVAHRDGALVAIDRHEVHYASDGKTRAHTNEFVLRDVQPDGSFPLTLPAVLQVETHQAELWASADRPTLFARPDDSNAIYLSRLDTGTNSFGPATLLHQAEAGHQLHLESLLPAPDGSAMLHCSEDWQIIPPPDYIVGLEQAAYARLPQDVRQRRDRLFWRGNDAGELSGAIRIKAHAIEGVGRGLDALPMGDGWLLLGRHYEFGNWNDPNDRDRIRLVSIGVDLGMDERPLAILWEDPDRTISGTRFSNPVRFDDGSLAILVSNRTQQKLPRSESITLLRFAPSTPSAE